MEAYPNLMQSTTPIDTSGLDEGESTLTKVIGSMFICSNPDVVNNEEPDCVDSTKEDLKYVDNETQEDYMSEMSRTLQSDGRIGSFSDDHKCVESEMDQIAEENDSDDHVSAYELVSSIDFGSSNGQHRRGDRQMAPVRVNRFVALCKTSMESEITVNQTESQDEIENTRDDIREGVSLVEETGSILPEYIEEDNVKCEEKREGCAERSKVEVEVNAEESNEENEEKCEVREDSTEETLEDKPCLMFETGLENCSLSVITDVEVDTIDDKTEVDCEKCDEEDIVIEREEIFRDVLCKKVDFDNDPSLLYRSLDTQSWDMAYEILRRSPEEARTWVYSLEKEASEYEWIFLPIHVACFSGAPFGLITNLVKAFPPGVRMAATGGKLPLHIACETLAHSNVITFLHSTYSEALYAIDNSGNTPLQETMFSESKSGRTRVMKLLTSLQAIEGQNGDDENAVPKAKPTHDAKVGKFFKKWHRSTTFKRHARSAL